MSESLGGMSMRIWKRGKRTDLELLCELALAANAVLRIVEAGGSGSIGEIQALQAANERERQAILACRAARVLDYVDLRRLRPSERAMRRAPGARA